MDTLETQHLSLVERLSSRSSFIEMFVECPIGGCPLDCPLLWSILLEVVL